MAEERKYGGDAVQAIRTASQAVSRGLAFAFAHRRRKKREFRALWITRLTAAVNQQGLLYSRFIHGLKKAGITLNRKELSELAIHDAAAFQLIVDRAKAAL